MPTTARKQSNAPRKHTLSKRARDNQENTPLPTKKRLKRVKFQHPDENNKSSSPVVISSSPPLSPSSEEPEDVSQHKYMLTKSIMLGSVSIYADSIMSKLGEFNYRNWEIEAMR